MIMFQSGQKRSAIRLPYVLVSEEKISTKKNPRMHPSLLPPKCHSNIQLKSQKTNVSTLVPQRLGHPSQEPLLEDHHTKEYHVIIL